METCKHNKSEGKIGFCWACAANRKAAYDLTGTHDPDEQKKQWDEVWKVFHRLQRAKFKRKLQGK